MVESVCGNGIREAGEQCDDGNTTNGDGCSSTCMVETPTTCDLIPQAGCTTTSSPACDLDATGASTACRAVTGTGTSLSHCPHTTDCEAGYTCLKDHDFPSQAPWCSPFCLGDLDCTGVGSRCLHQLTDIHGQLISAHVCTNACDPIHQTGCPSGMGCVGEYAPDTGPDYTQCIYMAGQADGSTCTDENQCKPGSDCVNDTTTGNAECARYCIYTPSQLGCPAGQLCTRFNTSLIIGTKEYGACL
jgi:cysteine-rich repeat protein